VWNIGKSRRPPRQLTQFDYASRRRVDTNLYFVLSRQ
jgi:hypothetical protein